MEMSSSMLLIGALAVVGIVAWLYLGGEPPADESAVAAPPSSFHCKVCGKKSQTFIAAHEHASADHDLAGHKIDEAIESD